MKCFIGIDLGSTTTKAVLMDESCTVLGRGITNSRSNYDTATQVAKREALTDTRFTLVRRRLASVKGVEAIGKMPRKLFVPDRGAARSCAPGSAKPSALAPRACRKSRLSGLSGFLFICMAR